MRRAAAALLPCCCSTVAGAAFLLSSSCWCPHPSLLAFLPIFLPHVPGSLFACIYAAAFTPDAAAFLVFLALAPVVVGAAALPFINRLPSQAAEQSEASMPGGLPAGEAGEGAGGGCEALRVLQLCMVYKAETAIVLASQPPAPIAHPHPPQSGALCLPWPAWPSWPSTLCQPPL